MARIANAAIQALAAMLAAAGVACLPPATPAADWEHYRAAFITPDGRVTDPFQNDGSHSEGQGYGLLLAVAHGDRATFERLLRWTFDNLGVRRDALFAWSWGRRPNGDWNIVDYNNASDGDALIALALARAAERWRHPPYREAAARIAADMRRHLAVAVQDHRLIAPAYYGFSPEGAPVFNTGYFVFPAYAAFAAIDEPAFWRSVRVDSLRVLAAAALSRFRLPPDWVELREGRVAIHAARGPFFGYEAIRAPLYLLWEDDPKPFSLFGDYLDFVERAGYLPRRVNLVEETVAMEEAPAGFAAVMAGCAERLGKAPLAARLRRAAAGRIAAEPRDYFSHSLYLLSGRKPE
jgi:endoglucanase